jgi:hypothetical protein
MTKPLPQTLQANIEQFLQEKPYDITYMDTSGLLLAIPDGASLESLTNLRKFIDALIKQKL